VSSFTTDGVVSKWSQANCGETWSGPKTSIKKLRTLDPDVFGMCRK